MAAAPGPSLPAQLQDRPLARAEANRENDVLKELVTIYHHLTGLALQNADVQAVIELLARRMGCRAAVVDPRLEVLAAAAPGLSTADAGEGIRESMTGTRLARVLGAVTRTRRALRLPAVGDGPASVVAPVLVGHDVPAYLLTMEDALEGGGEDTGLLVTEHAATICGVIMGRERVVAAAAGRVREDLTEGLLLGRARDAGEAQRWAQHLGYDASRAHQVVCMGLDGSAPPPQDPERAARRRRVFDSLERFVSSRLGTAVVAAQAGELVVVAPEDAPTPRQLGVDCIGHIRRTFPEATLTVGIGGRCREPGEIAQAYAQARRTIEIAHRLGRQGDVVAFDELGIHRLLLQVPDLGELRSFAEEVLGRLDAHDRRHRSGYRRTLAVYLRENGSLQRAAAQLHVHPNTVTYRLNRAAEITGLDLGRYQDRLMAQVALEIMEALEDRTA
jgi:sugar diacid utilization regulator